MNKWIYFKKADQLIIHFILTILMLFAANSANAQFTNSRWCFHVVSPFLNNWFISDVGANQTFTSPIACTNLSIEPDLNLRLLDSLIVNDSSLTTVYVDEIKIVSTLHLREKLELKKQTDDLGMFFSNFLSTYSTTPLGKISRYHDTLSLLAPLGSDSMDFILLSDSSLHAYLYMLSILIDEGGEPDVEFIGEMKTVCNNLTDTWRRSFIMVTDEIDTSVHDLIHDVSTTNIIESNIQHSYEAFLEYLTGIDTNEVYLEQLESIALQCVFEGGPGVIIARNLLAAKGDQSIYDDNFLCNTERQASFTNHSIQPIRNQILVYPNPSTGKFLLAFEVLEDDEVIKFEVTDLTGKIVHESLLNTNILNLDLSHLNSGVYLLNVSSNLKSFERIKLIKF